MTSSSVATLNVHDCEGSKIICGFIPDSDQTLLKKLELVLGADITVILLLRLMFI